MSQNWENTDYQPSRRTAEKTGNLKETSLLSIAGNIKVNIILNRTYNKIASIILPETQSRFTNKGGTTDMVFTL